MARWRGGEKVGPGRRCEMSALSHGPVGAGAERGDLSARLLVTEMWASVAIIAMWVVVAVSAVWGPDFVSTSSGGNSTTIPSGIAVAVFASIGTWAVAKHGFGRNRTQP
jgi:hypothetical protein